MLKQFKVHGWKKEQGSRTHLQFLAVLKLHHCHNLSETQPKTADLKYHHILGLSQGFVIPWLWEGCSPHKGVGGGICLPNFVLLFVSVCPSSGKTELLFVPG